MFALMDAVHGDIGPIFDDRNAADEALVRLREAMPKEADEYEVVELDRRGFPVDSATPSLAREP